MILLKLPDTNNIPDGRPGNCPYCGSQILQRWGRVTKPVKGGSDLMAVIYRYKCRDCKKTFRHYPQDVDRSGFTTSIRQLAVLLSAMGLSSRKIKELFDKLGVNLSHMTIWREGRELSNTFDGQDIKPMQSADGLDVKSILHSKKKEPLVIAVDLGNESCLLLGTMKEGNLTSILSWMRPLLKDVGIQVVQIEDDKLDHLKF
jgi:DNA-directed RNA polymerase subunit RPC12/RpoP